MLRSLAHALANAVAWFGITALGAAAILVDGVVLRGLAVGGAMASVAAAATWSVHQHFAGIAEESAMRSSMRDVVLGATEEATRRQVAALPRAIVFAKAATRRTRRRRAERAATWRMVSMTSTPDPRHDDFDMSPAVGFAGWVDRAAAP